MTETETKNLQERIESERKALAERMAEALERRDKSGEDAEEIKRRETALSEQVDKLLAVQGEARDRELDELKERLKVLEAEPEDGAERAGGQRQADTDGPARFKTRDEHGRLLKDAPRYAEGFNPFMDRLAAAKGDPDAAKRWSDLQKAYGWIPGATGEKQAPLEEMRHKAWATGDLEDVDLITPDIQAALPFLAAQQRIIALCRELRTTSPSVEFPVYTGGLTVDWVAEGQPKPEDEPTFDLVEARAHTLAGLSEIPNQTLEDYPVARGFVSSELGRATGVAEALAVLYGSGTGKPLGLLVNSDINHEAYGDSVVGGASKGRNLVSALFAAAQRVRIDGLTEPSDIVIAPEAWGDIVMSFEDSIGYLLGPATIAGGQGSPAGVPQQRLLGLPVTSEPYLGRGYGGTTPSQNGEIIVGNFQDAVVLRRSPFRVDVDTSLGFKVNTTWFRGEERMGFIVIRPGSFEVINGYDATG